MTIKLANYLGWLFMVFIVIDLLWLYLIRKYDGNDYRLQAIWAPALARTMWVVAVSALVGIATNALAAV